ncbi:unnamed protein product [Camellia sinensis]
MRIRCLKLALDYLKFEEIEKRTKVGFDQKYRGLTVMISCIGVKVKFGAKCNLSEVVFVARIHSTKDAYSKP